jgi:hypothetical protein
MMIVAVIPRPDWTLSITAEDGRKGDFDVLPFLQYEAFEDLKVMAEFMKVTNGGYFVEWHCGADLSADTIEAHWKVTGNVFNAAINPE